MCWCDFYRARSTEVHDIVRAKVNNGGVWSWSASGLQGVVGEKGEDGGLVGHLHQCAWSGCVSASSWMEVYHDPSSGVFSLQFLDLYHCILLVFILQGFIKRFCIWLSGMDTLRIPTLL